MIQQQKILGTIGYPGGLPALPTPFSDSLIDMLEFNHEAILQPGERIELIRAKQSLHDYARNELVKNMKGKWLLQLDTDLYFDPDLCARMLFLADKYEVDVLTGMYCYKKPPHLPVVYAPWTADNTDTGPLHTWDREIEPLPIGWSGAGCRFVRQRVFQRIIDELKEWPFTRIDRVGEDKSFFLRLHKLGIQAYCAWKVQVGHLRWQSVVADEHYGEVPAGGFRIRTDTVIGLLPNDQFFNRQQQEQQEQTLSI